MSSARLPIALAVLGLAACAHTPSESESTLSLANARQAAPVLVVESDQVPEGYDEHVVMIIDHDELERTARNDPNAITSHPTYGYPIYNRRYPDSVTPQSTPGADEVGIPSAGGGAIRTIRPPEPLGQPSRRSRY